MINEESDINELQLALTVHADRIIAALQAHPVIAEILSERSRLDRRRSIAKADRSAVR